MIHLSGPQRARSPLDTCLPASHERSNGSMNPRWPTAQDQKKNGSTSSSLRVQMWTSFKFGKPLRLETRVSMLLRSATQILTPPTHPSFPGRHTDMNTPSKPSSVPTFGTNPSVPFTFQPNPPNPPNVQDWAPPTNFSAEKAVRQEEISSGGVRNLPKVRGRALGRTVEESGGESSLGRDGDKPPRPDVQNIHYNFNMQLPTPPKADTPYVLLRLAVRPLIRLLHHALPSCTRSPRLTAVVRDVQPAPCGPTTTIPPGEILSCRRQGHVA
jgi:hypothetical protein